MAFDFKPHQLSVNKRSKSIPFTSFGASRGSGGCGGQGAQDTILKGNLKKKLWLLLGQAVTTQCGFR